MPGSSSAGLIGDIETDSRFELRHKVGYVTWISPANDIVEMKGRVASEIRTGYELLLSESIFNGVFNSPTPELLISLLL